MKKLIVIRGPLGIGKTTIAKKLASDLKAECVSIDEILKDYGLEKDRDYVAEDFIKANEIIIPKLKTILKKNNIIVEGNFYFQEVLEHLLKNTTGNHRVFTLKAPLEICLARDKQREKSLGPLATEAIYSLVNRFDYGIPIDGRNRIGKIVEEIINNL
ncbi:MAG: AAA family ATPase [Patescibacteria group bacterium]